MNPKIKKLRAERAKNDDKIAKLTARNEEVDKEIMNLENLDIIGLVRAVGAAGLSRRVKQAFSAKTVTAALPSGKTANSSPPRKRS